MSERLRELVERLCAPGHIGDQISASECHEIRDEVLALLDGKVGDPLSPDWVAGHETGTAEGWRDAIQAGEGIRRIGQERLRQVEQEGWDYQHDDDHEANELAWAAACYAAPMSIYAAVWRPNSGNCTPLNECWPWDRKWDKRPIPPFTRQERIRALEKAGALCAAEIDRLLRQEQRKDSNP